MSSVVSVERLNSCLKEYWSVFLLDPKYKSRIWRPLDEDLWNKWHRRGAKFLLRLFVLLNFWCSSISFSLLSRVSTSWRSNIGPWSMGDRKLVFLAHSSSAWVELHSRNWNQRAILKALSPPGSDTDCEILDIEPEPKAIMDETFLDLGRGKCIFACGGNINNLWQVQTMIKMKLNSLTFLPLRSGGKRGVYSYFPWIWASLWLLPPIECGRSDAVSPPGLAFMTPRSFLFPCPPPFF